MNQETNQKKHFPISMPKKKFQALYASLPEPHFRNGLNEIIVENRKDIPNYKGISPDKLKKTRTVLKAEMIEFAKCFGVPENYELDT
jgi:hypothetical protein